MLHGLYHNGSQIVKATKDRGVFLRGPGDVYYVLRRIPRALLTAYPRGQKEIARSLRTADPKEARSKAILELAAIEREFRARRSGRWSPIVRPIYHPSARRPRGCSATRNTSLKSAMSSAVFHK